ncbi:MAG: hypothetical protein QM614_07075, partial [Ottowia sp.]
MTGTPPPLGRIRRARKDEDAAAEDAIERHRAALRERFPLPPELDGTQAPPPRRRRKPRGP